MSTPKHPKNGPKQAKKKTVDTSAARAAALENRRKAVELRRTGMSYLQIAVSLGMSKGGVYKAVRKALDDLTDDIREDARRLQAQEADRLDTMQVKVWPGVLKGDLKAVDRALNIMARRARLLGLDQPTKIAPTSPDGESAYDPDAMTPEERIARIEELEAKRRGRAEPG